MRETLLIIDGRGQPESLVRILEKAGFFCVYARGPLKVKALLKEHPVALIVWKDNTGNADLSRDLTRAWKPYPKIPVVHLYAREPSVGAAEAETRSLTVLPIEAADGQLLPVIERILGATKPAPPSELSVLGAAARKPSRAEAASGRAAPLQPQRTGLTSDERASLFEGQGGPRGSRWTQTWQKMRRRFSRTRAQPDSTRI